jgi:sugar/nucleoside kinase (ribokinase family)
MQLQRPPLVSRPLDVLTVSDMCVDLVLTGNVRPVFQQVEQIVGGYALELGGSANIFASQLAKLGSRVGVIGYVGQDLFGEFVLCELQKAGVDTTRIKKHPSVKTGIGVALTEKDDRAILTYPGSIDATQAGDLEETFIRSCRHWHITSYFLLQSLRFFWPEWIQKCRKEGLTISLDTNWDPENEWEGVIDLLPDLDLFLPNEAEAISLTGETDVWKAANVLAERGPLTVVKRGANGAIAIKGSATWNLNADDPSSSLRSLVDTIGAGDNFDAGFIHAWLSGQDVDSSLRLAHRCASSSLNFPGGILGQLKEDAVSTNFTLTKDGR